MKIEVIIQQMNGRTKRYLVHKLVYDGEVYTAYFSVIKSGFHVPQKVRIDNVNAKIAINNKITSTKVEE